MQKVDIDGGKEFDWGRASSYYARYRDIYPEEFYTKIFAAGIAGAGQRVLDLGTGTGVLPRNLARFGARFTGTDISKEQIDAARRLSADAGCDAEYLCVASEDIALEEESFDAATACQCFFYFDHARLAPKLNRVLKADSKFAILYVAWLPREDKIAAASEALVLQYNPKWSGRDETRRPIDVPEVYEKYFTTETREVFDLEIPFTRESWHGRILACRGIGATLSQKEIARFDAEHKSLLESVAPKTFRIRHYAAMTVLRKK